MSNKNDDPISTYSRMEEEKQIFGGYIYENSHKFPIFFINNDPESPYYIERFSENIGLMKLMCETCGIDMSNLLAEIYKIYEMEEYNPDDLKPTHKIMIQYCADSLAIMALALNQSEKLFDKLKNFDKTKEINLEIRGEEYCFLVIVLNNIFNYYSNIFNFILTKKYLGKEFIKDINEKLTFIISEEMELMRKIFKVLECYELLEQKPTFH